MSMSPIEIVKAFLKNPSDHKTVGELVAPDVTYVSLNYDNPDLKKILPWTGTGKGPDAITSTFERVQRYWSSENFEILEMFGSGDNVAVFGRFTYRSTTLGKAATSPFAMLVKVSDGKVTYMQFMEDTFATSETFRSGGTATYRSNPDGGEVRIAAS